MTQTVFPKVSIITVTYNAAAVLRSTIESVINVNYPNLEYIIVDGASRDSTVMIAGEYKEYIGRFVSEPDKGVFDAMNKGTQLATGDWLLYLNAGDLIYDADVFLKLRLDELGDMALIYGDTNDIGIGIRQPFSMKSLKYGMIMACHQSMLFNKPLLKTELYYSNDFSFYNDYELVVRILKKGFKAKYKSLVIASYLGGGISSQVSGKARFDRYKMMFRLYGIKGVVSALLFRAGYRPF